MPIYTDAVEPQIAQLTNKGRELESRKSIGEIAFKYEGWAMGRGGYDINNVVKPAPIDPSNSILIDQIFPLTGYLPFNAVEEVSDTTLVFVLRIPPNTNGAGYGIGEVGIWATVTASINSSEVGQSYLMIISHMPITCITPLTSRVMRLLVNF